MRPYAWICLSRVETAYFDRERNWRTLLNYSKEIGLRRTARKVRSRMDEGLRNEKFVSCGLGTVVDSDIPGELQGDVAFVAPFHARCMERVVLSRGLIRGTTARELRRNGSILFLDQALLPTPSWAQEVAGWSDLSGIPLNQTAIGEGLRFAARAAADASTQANHRVLPTGSSIQISSLSPENLRGGKDSERPKAILFGYGNYCKSVLVPSVKQLIDIDRIHDLDPMQIHRSRTEKSVTWSTEGMPQPFPQADAVFVAGYHHTHADLALQAWDAGCINAVVEKPIATEFRHLEGLLTALISKPERKLYAGFQRRYAAYNELVVSDIPMLERSPMTYSVAAFEEPLPKLHWYRWPHSRGRIVSNGCHWIDHFLFLNGFSPVAELMAQSKRNGDVLVVMELENESLFSMTLTDRGSPRIGMQNAIEIRCADRTVRILNDSYYLSESATRILKRKKMNRLMHHERMYRTIARKIVDQGAGDSIKSVETSTRAVLEAESQLH